MDPATGRPRTMLISLINVNSPMVYDATMLGALKVYARANQATIITPFILSGAMSPVTVAGTAAQTLAEALAGMAFAQLVNPGAPVVLGSFASSISMQSGAPTFGTPEPALVLYTMAALARRLGVPFRSGGSLCASKVPDAQAAFESAQTLLPTCLAGVNFVLHTAGWLEGGLAMGYEKFMMDVDQAGMMHTLLAGVDLSRERPGHGRNPRSRARQPFPRLRAHAGKFRKRVLPVAARRQQQLRAVAGRRLARHGAARQRAVEAATRQSTSSRRSTQRSTRRCSITSIGARPRRPIRTSDSASVMQLFGACTARCPDMDPGDTPTSTSMWGSRSASMPRERSPGSTSDIEPQHRCASPRW